MENFKDVLLNFKRNKEYLVCIDSDGCVFDNMELKHKECFCPATVNVWNLQGVSRYAREAAEFVNLYSDTRGTNRFPALVRTLELTYERDEVKERGYKMPDIDALKNWIATTPVLGAVAIEEYCKNNEASPILLQAAKWSHEVDDNIERIVRNVPPLPYVKEALEQYSKYADIVIVSATPHEAIVREWENNDLLKYVNVVAGQEMGTKEECIRAANSDRYEPDHILMIGDAPGDKKAALANNVLFRPIVPGRETESWKEIFEKDSDSFKNGTYKDNVMEQRFEEFDSVLLKIPPLNM